MCSLIKKDTFTDLKTEPNTAKKHRRHNFVLAAMVLVLLTSCSIKNGLKFLSGFQVNTEQGLGKKASLFSENGLEKCYQSVATTSTKISQEISSNANDLLPAVLLTVTFLFLSGYTVRREQLHPLYGNTKISGTLPIFLQYRKLII